MLEIQLLVQTLQAKAPRLTLLQGQRMSPYTTFRIGGPVPLMAFPETEEQVITCVSVAEALGIRFEVIGNGSNLLIADEGVDAFFIHTGGLNRIVLQGTELVSGAGASLARLATFAARNQLAGLVFAHGIPGTLGGAVLMNAGAYGGEMSSVIVSTRYLMRGSEILICNGAEHDFAYRHSVFSESGAVILGSTLRLTHGDESVLMAQMKEYANKRRTTQPLEYPSGGSMFKRPESGFAASLIDLCGLKGFSVGGAQVSEKHAGFVVNRGGATCQDVLALVETVQKQVYIAHGVTLEMEVKIIR